jgi:hypothetical protein
VGQLPNPMTLTFALLALTSIVSFGILLLNILSAPEGHEDEAGFHSGTTDAQARGLPFGGEQLKQVSVFAKVPVRQIAA